MKLYIYNMDTKEVITICTGNTEQECEQKAEGLFDEDMYGATYTPAFGCVDGLKVVDVPETL